MKANDITLNFLDKYYMFYEWLDSDDIEQVNNIYVYNVSTKVINDFINYDIKININQLKGNEKKYIFTDSYSFIAIEFNDKGESTYKSSLQIEDEIKISLLLNTKHKDKIEYQKIRKSINNNDLRINDDIKKVIKTEILNSNDEKLIYLYYEWFKIKDDNINNIKKVMLNQIEKPITNKEEHIYNLIKLSYKLV